MNLYDDLDFILTQLDSAKDKKLTVQINPDHKDPIGELIKRVGTKEILIELLDILKEEKFIEYGLIDHTTQFNSKYHGMVGEIKLTVHGKYFVLEGKYKERNANHEKQIFREKLLRLYACLAGIGTFGILIFEVHDKYPLFPFFWLY